MLVSYGDVFYQPIVVCITLWSFDIAMQNGPFIDDFPSYNPPFMGDFPWQSVSHNQMVRRIKNCQDIPLVRLASLHRTDHTIGLFGPACGLATT